LVFPFLTHIVVGKSGLSSVWQYNYPPQVLIESHLIARVIIRPPIRASYKEIPIRRLLIRAGYYRVFLNGLLGAFLKGVLIGLLIRG
jgi:hypothetical protein